ncbi:MAG TPA: rod shape-determining protein MreC [Bacteroidetes bacterium]|nr:rod shape-determining protein MreC [Bacteroidota bacterium]
MRNLLLLNSKIYTVILFILLEVISFTIIVNYNNKQKDIFLYSSNLFSGYINTKYHNALEYFKLGTKIKELRKENAKLFQKLYNKNAEMHNRPENDDSLEIQFKFIEANIINKSINKRNNRFTLDRGKNAGLHEGMGVVDADGVVGVIWKVNSKYASVVPIINTVSRVSVLIKNRGYFGVLKWEPYDYKKAKITAIPKHAYLEKGDSVLTSGFSTIFPKGILIGVIEDFHLDRGSNYYDITVKLNNDLALAEQVYVIDNKDKELQKEVEK